MSGCWPNYVRKLVEEVHAIYAVFFFFYVSFVIFAVTRIISALFLRDTLQVAQNDEAMMIRAKMSRRKKFEQKLADVFVTLDKSGDGSITKAEFVDMLEAPEMQAYMSILEFEIDDAVYVFDLIDDGDGRLSYVEFLKGLARCKGAGRSMDVIAISHDVCHVVKMCKHLGESIDSLRSELNKGTSACSEI